MTTIHPNVIEQAYTYEAYCQLIADLLVKKETTGDDNSEAMLHYTNMNVVRMNRLDKKVKLHEETIEFLDQLQDDQIWLILTEGWCADAAQTIPVMHKMAEASAHIELRLILRDQHLDIMDQFLTNGGRSIPKLIVLNKDLEVLASWGPRPTDAQTLMLEAKEKISQLENEARKAAVEQLKIDIQKWYNKDKTIQTQTEIREKLRG
ncbi:MAG: thioredoxin family protein [Bacteroidota bacterium]